MHLNELQTFDVEAMALGRHPVCPDPGLRDPRERPRDQIEGEESSVHPDDGMASGWERVDVGVDVHLVAFAKDRPGLRDGGRLARPHALSQDSKDAAGPRVT